jgi:transcriptional regulator with XRE-family HTH domain
MDAREVVGGGGNRRRASCGAAQEKEQPVVAALRLFVELSGLRLPRVARLMGVGEATLSKWLDGTVQPTQKKLLEIESFLVWHGREYLANPEQRDGARGNE